MISRMHRVEIVGPVALLDSAMDTIQSLGTVHLETIPLSEYGEKQFLHRVSLKPEQQEESEILSELIEMLRETIEFIPASSRPKRDGNRQYAAEYGHWENESLGTMLVTARSLHAKNRSFARRQRNLKDDIQGLASYEELVGALAPLVEANELPEGYEFKGIVLEGKNHMPIDLFEKELQKLTNGEYRFYTAPTSNKRVCAVVGFPHRVAKDIRGLIADSGIGEMSLPRYMKDSPFEKALAQMQEDLISLRKRLKDVEEQAKTFYEQKSMELLAMYDVCTDRNSKYNALNTIAVTKYNFILWGWVPNYGISDLRTGLNKISEEKIVLQVVKKPPHENPPVQLENAEPFKPFEPLLKLFPLPKYGSVDPTKYLATIFPPIFGLMLADIAYGVLVGVIAGILYATKKASKMARQVSFIMALCAFFTIAFGFLFGEFLGNIGHDYLGLKAIWQERFSFTAANKTELLMAYMVVAVAVGVFHIVLGLVLGIINSRKTGSHGVILDSLAKIVGIFFLLFLVGRLSNVLPPEFTAVWIVALILFAVLMLAQIIRHPSHGMMLPIELMGTMGNILSYIRIMAVGMVSVVLAYLANLFGGMMGSLVVGVIIAALVHALNLALGIIDPAIQGLRLHYVEFFSKFFVGGGTPYTPFRKIGGML